MAHHQEWQQALRAASADAQAVDWTALPGWRDADHDTALAAFRRSCDGQRRADMEGMDEICAVASETGDPADARGFFETHFTPYAVDPGTAGSLLTGYFEPELSASRNRSGDYQVPLHAVPDDLLEIGPEDRLDGFPEDVTGARRGPDGLVPYWTRGEIMDGALGGARPIAFLADPVDAFFVHIQGSTRLVFDDGNGSARIGYAGRNGHPYRSVGRLMRDRGLGPDPLTAEAMKDWLKRHPETADDLLRHNPSYIFFREIADLNPDLGPVGAAGVQLTAGVSLAVDPRFHAYGLPVFVDADLPSGRAGDDLVPFRRLMVAQDTGSAIRGPVRGDIFWGTGAEAGEIAGRFQHPGRFFVLLPKSR